MPSLSLVVLLGLLLVGNTAVAQLELASSVPGARRIELTPEGAGKVTEVGVSPGLSTMLLFDSELQREGIELEGRHRFSLVDVGQATLRLVPTASATPGERFKLVVRFRDGAAPLTAVFLLKVHPAKAEATIEIYREQRTIETYQQEVRDARAEVLRCKEELARIVSEHEAPGGLTGLLFNDGLDPNGVAGQVLTKAVAKTAANGLGAAVVNSYRSTRLVAVDVWIEVRIGTLPWTAEGATLKSRSGEELKILQVWQSEPILPGPTGRVIVEAEAPAAAVQGPFSLKLWEADGPRSITLGNVTFP
ncbi:DUF2381 family protein [Corallococcus aberystwythensis]|uniref:DUF2381 family protein n=1 Tax=Corallococcus aberystwythensis TaxID=2316722 RepID=A0A3A8Q7H3_9BACT|nr:DUF2381 family protein [Corallococcus aberystwythensis]RKH63461.1 DUF2381 family protein [Corallococcus aberystwythensis]